MEEMQVQSLGRKEPLEEGTATHSSILAWRIPWTEEPGGLQSMESQSQPWLKWLNMHARRASSLVAFPFSGFPGYSCCLFFYMNFRSNLHREKQSQNNKSLWLFFGFPCIKFGYDVQLSHPRTRDWFKSTFAPSRTLHIFLLGIYPFLVKIICI